MTSASPTTAQPPGATLPTANGAPAEAPRRRVRELEVMVADAVQETPDTTTLYLFTGNERLDYKPGHFLTIDPHQFEALDRFTRFLEDLKGRREPARAYSMSSAPHEKYLAVTVKEEAYVSGATKYPPLLSPILVKRTTRGTRMVVTGFTGPYVLPDDVEQRTDHLVHVCAGSGIVPNFSILKHCLTHHPRVRHTVVYSNRTCADVIFGDELEALRRRHPDTLRVLHTLTREVDVSACAPGTRHGRVNEELLREAIPDPSAALAYVCGPGVTVWDKQTAKANGTPPPPRFLETSVALLKEIGVPPARIKHESYG